MSRKRRFSFVVLAFVALSFLYARSYRPALSSAASARADVERAWKMAKAVGEYDYRTDIRQVARPLPRLANVGLGSQESRFYLEGQVDMPAETMRLQLWAEGGTVLDGADSIEIEIADGKAMGRTEGGEWTEVESIAEVFAPGGDPLGFLAAARDIELLDTELRGVPVTRATGETAIETIAVSRYTFDVDGKAFAEHLRRLSMETMQRKGELPAHVELGPAKQYLDMTGSGEIWLDAKGLPLRQTVTLVLPPDEDEEVVAEIKTDFSSWGPRMATLAGSGRMIGALRLQAATIESGIARVTAGRTIALVASLGAVLALLLLFSAYRRSIRVYATVVTVVILVMLVDPILQSRQLYAFNALQHERRMEARQRKAQQDEHRDVLRMLHSSTFDPGRPPLSSAQGTEAGRGGLAELPVAPSTVGLYDAVMQDVRTREQILAESADSDDDGLPDHVEDLIGSDRNSADSDRDGLEDGVEALRLGTDPADADSDGDGISDRLEVEGFEDASGKRWYLNPLDNDTNRDGMPDGVECPEAPACPDTDGDGLPNVLDTDDDGDRVPDRDDRSPGSAMGSSQNAIHTLELQIDQLSPGRAAYVDFQIRPADSKHLWYALNVLDWPTNDREGQVNRISSSTLGTSGAEANGDMRLVPMLEIEIPGQRGSGDLPTIADKPGIPALAVDKRERGRQMKQWLSSWLDEDKMASFGVSVRPKDEFGGVVAYVPLNVVRDAVGESVIAFEGRMPYWPEQDHFGPKHKVRLAWLVQAITDSCKPVDPAFLPGFDAAVRDDAWCGYDANWTENPPSIIHTYYEDWYVTGLSVREELGVKAAIVSEPDRDPGLPYEPQLWNLADSLDKSFMSGRRDVTVEEIRRRFHGGDENGDGQADNALVSDDLRWGIPGDALRVKMLELPDQTALATIPMTHTKQVLSETFLVPGSEPPIARVSDPTLLFLREESYRVANLDQGADVVVSSGFQNKYGAPLALKLDPSVIKPQVMAGMNWAPYQYRGAGVWDVAPIKDYLQGVGDRYQVLFGNGQVHAGQAAVAMGFYLTLFQGAAGIVESGGVPLVQVPAVSDKILTSDAQTMLKKGISPIKSIVSNLSKKATLGVYRQEIVKSFDSVDPLTVKDRFHAALGGIKSGFKADVKLVPATVEKLGGKLGLGKTQTVGLLAVGALAAVGLLVGLTAGLGVDAAEMVDYLAKGVGVALAAKGVYDAVQGAVKAAAPLIQQAGRVAGMIGFLVSNVLQLGAFFVGLLTGLLKDSRALWTATANLYATLIVGAMAFAIGLIPVVGQVLVAVLGVLEAVIGVVCKIVGAEGGICNGFLGSAIKALAGIFYSEHPLVDLSHPKRLEITDHRVTPWSVEAGYTVGNAFNHRFILRSTLYPHSSTLGIYGLLVGLPVWNWGSDLGEAFRRAQIGPDDRQTTLKYRLQIGEKVPFHTSLRFGQSPWDEAGRKYDIVSKDLRLTTAGVNVKLPDMVLSEGYVIPTVERVLWNTSDKFQWGTNYLPLPNQIFDVFPATLSQFYTLARAGLDVDGSGASYALDWGGRGSASSPATDWTSRQLMAYAVSGDPARLLSPSWPVLADADGDGLRSLARGGNDPDDSRPDIDGDGLSDFVELRQGSNPKVADSDGDGLSDYEEALRGTQADLADSDHDGLSDRAEIEGWIFDYGMDGRPRLTRVDSDPLQADTDGDGAHDGVEKVFGTHPRVASSAVAGGQLRLVSSITSRSLVRPGQTIDYRIDVANSFSDTLGTGTVDSVLSAGSGATNSWPYSLGPQQWTGHAGRVTVDAGVRASQVVSLSHSSRVTVRREGETATRTIDIRADQAVTIDADKPTVRLDAATRYVPAGDRIIAIEAADATTAVERVRYQIDGGSFQAAVRDGDAWVFRFEATAEGSHAIALEATDAVGNVSEPARATIVVDASAPSIALDPALTAGPVALEGDRFLRLKGAIEDAASGVAEAMVELIDETGAPLSSPQVCCPATAPGLRQDWEHSHLVPPGTRGVVRLRFALKDAVGNAAVVLSEPVRIDSDAPRAQVTSTGPDSTVIAGPAIHGTVSDVPQPDGSRFHLHFEEAAGATTFVDGSPAKSNAVCAGASCPAAAQPGKLGSALRFDGSDDYLTLPEVALTGLDLGMTFAAWVNWSGGGSWQRIFDIGRDSSRYMFLTPMSTDGSLRFAIATGGFPTEQRLDAPALSPDTWSHVVVTLQDGSGKLYVNGKLVDSRKIDLLPSQVLGDNRWLGRSSFVGDPYFAGHMDEVAVYGRALTGDEIAAMADPSAAGVERLEVSFRHVQHAAAPPPDLALAFEDPAAARSFFDASPRRAPGFCAIGRCPVAGVPGKFGSAAAFDGIDDQVETDAAIAGRDAFAVAAWVRSSATKDQVIISQHGETDAAGTYRLMLGADGRPRWVTEGDGPEGFDLRSSQVVSDGHWHHVVGLREADGTARIYVDGVAAGAQAASPASLAGAIVQIGANGRAPARHFEGAMDDVLVFGDSLGPAQVAALAAPDRWQPATIDRPGERFSTWSLDAPADLEGIYSVDLRAVDRLGQVRLVPSAWHGIVDTQAPRVTFGGRVFGPTLTVREFRATDFSLRPALRNLEPLQFATTQVDTRDFDAPWYVDAVGDSQHRLYEISSPAPFLTTRTAGDRLRVCDVYDHCSEAELEPEPSAERLDIALVAPAVLTSTKAVSLTLHATAADFLRYIAVTMDGQEVWTSSFSRPAATEQTKQDIRWTPPGEGRYILGARVEDYANAPDPGETRDSLETRVLVDGTPPALTIDTMRVNGENLDDEGFVTLDGTANDVGGLHKLELQVGDDAWQEVPVPSSGGTWRARVFSGLNVSPDGQRLTVRARATDAAGWVTTVQRSLNADATPPSPPIIALTYAGPDGPVPMQPGDTLHDASVPTTLSWTASHDGSDVVRYRVGWTATPTLTDAQVEALSVYASNQEVHDQVLHDGDVLYAHVVAVDGAGNTSLQSTSRPIYVDDVETPDRVSMDDFGSPYRGWMGSGCTLIGVDGRRARGPLAAVTEAQTLYASWSTEGLRLAWTGASWDADGDLFIYLDTRPGGAIRAYDPFTRTQTSTRMLLPPSMGADFLVWVRDDQDASLLAWNGGAWSEVGATWDYVFAFDGDIPTTDLFLPFAALDVVNPAATALQLVAFATDEQALRPWATMPNRNPVNSSRVGGAATDDLLLFALTQPYTWPALGEGLCPARAQVAGSPVSYASGELRVEIGADLPGVDYAILSGGNTALMSRVDELAGLADWEAEWAALCADHRDSPECRRKPDRGTGDIDVNPERDLAGTTDVDPPAVGDGTTVEYRLEVVNQGSTPASGVVAEVKTWGQVRLPAGALRTGRVDGETWQWYTQRVDVGDVAAGASKTVTFEGRIDTGFDGNNRESWATVSVTVLDDLGSVIDWAYMDHIVDAEPPAYVEILSPVVVAKPGLNTVRGIVRDASAVPDITLEIGGPGLPAREVLCHDDTPEDGTWSCDVDFGSLVDGQSLRLRARATDVHGQVGAWSDAAGAAQPLVVDAAPPTVSLGERVAAAFETGVIDAASTLIGGVVTDDGLVSAVDVCTSAEAERCLSAELALDPAAMAPAGVTQLDLPASPLRIDAGAACTGRGIVRSLPVSERFTIADVDLGVELEHELRDDLVVKLASPAGTEITLVDGSLAGRNYNLRFDDAAPLGAASDRADHDLTASGDAHPRAPLERLSRFNGQSSAGTWSLKICDRDPSADHGAYLSASLILRSAEAPPSTTSRWSYALDPPEEDGGETHALYIYGVDAAGNRSSEPIALSYRVDTVAPVLTVDDSDGRVALPLSGTVSDGVGVDALELVALAADGTIVSDTIPVVGREWTYADASRLPVADGFVIWIQARDVAGNTTVAGPYPLVSEPGPPRLRHRLYLPTIQLNAE